MIDNNEIQIKKIIESLPAAIRKVVESKELTITIEEIGNKHDLYIWQVGALVHECMLTLIGVHSSYDFIKNLKKNLEINEELAEKLRLEINEKIFKTIRKSMIEARDAYNENPNKEDILNEIENPTSYTINSPVAIPDLNVKQNLEEDLDPGTPPFEIAKPSEDVLDLPWDHQPVTISSKLLEDKLFEVVKLPKEHVDIHIDVDAIEKAEEEHKREEVEEKAKRNSYLEWQAKQREIAEAKKAAARAAANTQTRTVDSLSMKNIPPLRVRKAYESDPYREPVE